MNHQEQVDEALAQIIGQLLEYAKNKGQIYSAVRLAILKHYLSMLEGMLGIKIPLKGIIDDIVRLSVHEPAYYETVWLRALDKISIKNLQLSLIEAKKRRLGGVIEV